jgi:DnaJ-class molecular chaperone
VIPDAFSEASAADPLCEACRGSGRVPGEVDDPCPWCEGEGRASAAKVRARRLANLATRIERLKRHRAMTLAEATEDAGRLDAMILQVEAQRAALLAEDG